MPSPFDPSDLPRAQLEAQVVDLLGENSELKQIVAAQRDEIARLKGLKGRPWIKPSGMEDATNPKRGGKRVKRRGRGKVTPRAVAETEVLRVAQADVGGFARFQIDFVGLPGVEDDMTVEDDDLHQLRDRADVTVGLDQGLLGVVVNRQQIERNRRAEANVRAVGLHVDGQVFRPLNDQCVGRFGAVCPGDAGAEVEGLHRRLRIRPNHRERTEIDIRCDDLPRDPAGLAIVGDAQPLTIGADSIGGDFGSAGDVADHDVGKIGTEKHLRADLGSHTGNRAALEAASKAIEGVARILDEFKTSSRDYVEVLRLLLEKTDGTMRSFTDVLVKSGVETATQTDWLREALPAIEANAQTLLTAAERISRAIEDLRARRLSPERETID